MQCINLYIRKNNNQCVISKTNEFSVSKHPNMLLLKRGETDVNKSETSCDSKIIYGKIEHAGHVQCKILCTKLKKPVSFTPLKSLKC